MHSTSQAPILWASILASAVVAGFVTVLIEYLAKPQLEARKERILDSCRRERDALYGISLAVQRARLIRSLSRVSTANEPHVQERIRKLAVEIDQFTDAAYATLTPPESTYPYWSYIAGYITSLAVKFQVDPPSSRAISKLMPAFEDLELYKVLFETSRWRRQQRHIIINKLIEHHADRTRKKETDAKSKPSRTEKNRRQKSQHKSYLTTKKEGEDDLVHIKEPIQENENSTNNEDGE